MAKKAKRREWTKSDVKELKTMARNKTPAPKIAKALKRTGATTVTTMGITALTGITPTGVTAAIGTRRTRVQSSWSPRNAAK